MNGIKRFLNTLKNNKVYTVSLVFLMGAVAILLREKIIDVRAAMYDNQVGIKYAKITSIKTGTAGFDSDDGLGGNNSSIAGYTPGADSSENNRIVRSFDYIDYEIELMTYSRNNGFDLSDVERTVNVTVDLPEDQKEYVKFSNSRDDNIYSFTDIPSDSSMKRNIRLYILGAPNGMELSPTFKIQESTDTESPVTIGKNETENCNEDTKICDSYENDNGENRYSYTGNIINYMPTVVSSKQSFDIAILNPDNNQSATYNNIIGRYMNFGIKLYLKGTDSTGIKGLNMPKGDIKFRLTLTNDGHEPLVFDNKWVRNYSYEAVDSIEPQLFSMPYSNKTGQGNSTYNAGNITATKVDDNNYDITISDYAFNNFPANTAKGEEISKSEGVFGTYVFTVFSGRNSEDAKNPITITNTMNGLNAVTTSSSAEQLTDLISNNNSVTAVNEYYEYVDYSLQTYFADINGNQLSEHGYGGATKGEEILYRTTFDYDSKLTKTGIKETIKVDPRAFRVLPYSDKEDIKLTFTCGKEECKNISKDDFIIKYVTGTYEPTNYDVTNNTESNIDSKILNEDRETVINECSMVATNLANYSRDQVMNLYGGPCIKAKDGVENEFSKIVEAKTSTLEKRNKENQNTTPENTENNSTESPNPTDENNTTTENESTEESKDLEIPITKIIIESKEGVNITDNVKIGVDTKLRVRDVPDITQTYQATASVTSSSSDEKIKYYSPDVNAITNPNNYQKTIINGSTSSNPWGDSLQVINFKARTDIYTTNKNADGTTKTSFIVTDNDVINYKVDINIEDYNESVGADDVWFIKYLKVTIDLPEYLEYIENSKLGKPTSIINNGRTLVYELPYTKANWKIDSIKFQARLNPSLPNGEMDLTTTSRIEAINVNDEIDTSYKGNISSYTIHATGVNAVIVSQRVNPNISDIIQKDKIASYLLSAYNNTTSNTSTFKILDILPYTNDGRGSKFSGSYKVKVILPDELNNETTKVLCFKGKDAKDVQKEVDDNRNEWTECNILDEFVSTPAIKIENINIQMHDYMPEIEVQLQTEGNNYSDIYVNDFYGKEGIQTKSNSTEVTVVSRKLSGRAFYDINENGIEDNGDRYIKDIAVSLCKLNTDNSECKEVATTTTNDKGEYLFKDLDKGRYEIKFGYDPSKYDITLRYATDDISKDSDAYKLDDEGHAAITNKREPEESIGLRLNESTTSIEDLNIGLIIRKGFEAEIKKYITKVELNSNGVIETHDYDNLSIVSLSVKNSRKATAKIYYGFAVTNIADNPGFVKNIEETIPEGLEFDQNENPDWILSGDKLYNTSLADTVIEPHETKYLKIVLNMPRQEVARRFLNTVAVLQTELYDPEIEKLGEEYREEQLNNFHTGEEVNYAGVVWNVVKQEENGDVVLLAQRFPNSSGKSMAQSNNTQTSYSWSKSDINTYINGDTWKNQNSMNTPILVDNYVCDDPSGMRETSNGGALKGQGTCATNIFVTSKLRLLTEEEVNYLNSNLGSDRTMLNGYGDFWMSNTDNTQISFNGYNEQTDETKPTNTKGKYYSTTTGTVSSDVVTNSKVVRPVIVINKYNLRVQP